MINCKTQERVFYLEYIFFFSVPFCKYTGADNQTESNRIVICDARDNFLQ